jgi:predicted CoA-binding protein
MPIERDDEIRDLLASVRTIAVVGASDNPGRPSYGVMRSLQDHGYRVLPINPRITGEHIHGEYVWRDLDQIGEPIDMVDVFRRSEDVDQAVDDAIRVGAKAIWMQIGVVNPTAAARAEAAGLKVVMDRCPKIELVRLNVPPVAAAG